MRARHLLVLVTLAAACDPSPPTDTGAGGKSGSGGTFATGGASTGGGASASGGASATGGTIAMGGTKGSGGASAAGGAAGSGGTTGRGGATAMGGATGMGGRTGVRRDAGTEVKLDGGVGTGGSGIGAGGTGGARADASPDESGVVARDAGADTGFFKPGPVPDGGSCPFKGNVTYTLKASSDPAADQQIKAAMDQAIFYYNCYTNLTRALTVSYESSVATADGNINGNIRFGPSQYRTLRVAMHEMGHTFGIGTASNWNSFIDKGSSSSGPWTGKNGIAQRDALLPDHWQDSQRVLTADSHCFWPYGLSQDHDYTTEDDLIGHCMMIMAIRKDLGL
jgi:hypothetical protein